MATVSIREIDPNIYFIHLESSYACPVGASGQPTRRWHPLPAVLGLQCLGHAQASSWTTRSAGAAGVTPRQRGSGGVAGFRRGTCQGQRRAKASDGPRPASGQGQRRAKASDGDKVKVTGPSPKPDRAQPGRPARVQTTLTWQSGTRGAPPRSAGGWTRRSPACGSRAIKATMARRQPVAAQGNGLRHHCVAAIGSIASGRVRAPGGGQTDREAVMPLPLLRWRGGGGWQRDGRRAIRRWQACAARSTMGLNFASRVGAAPQGWRRWLVPQVQARADPGDTPR